MPGHVVVAPDKFKGSLGAAAVALAVADGLRAAVPGIDAREHPVADGGDGTVEAAMSAGFARKEVPCTGPTGDAVTAALAVRDEIAVVELAEASGLRRLPGGRLAATTATSRGTGELIRAALDLGCRQVVLGLGGSACTDGGAGMIQALGGRLLDAAGAELALGGASLADLDRLDLSGFDPRVAGTEFVVASDVDNPLLGPYGTAAVYGPQKGASAAEVALLDAALARWAAAARAATGVDAASVAGAGAAGGVGFAAVVFLGAELRSGIEYLLDLLEVRSALPGARGGLAGRADAARQGARRGGGRGQGRRRAGRRGRRPQHVAGVGARVRRHRAGLHLVRDRGGPRAQHARAGAAAASPCRPHRGRLAGRWPVMPGDPEVKGFDLVVRAPRVVTAAGEVPRCVAVRDGRVAAIEPLAAALSGERTVTLPDSEVLLPGLADTHVHVNEPGRTEWEGFATATRAAAAGGITTILDMPLNSIPPTVDVAALEVKRKAAEGNVHVDVGFWGGAIPGNLGELRSLHDAGVFGFKCFLLHSGVDEFPHLDAEQLDEYLGVLSTFPALLLVHAEDSQAVLRAPSAHGERYADFLASRPRGAENVAIAHVIESGRWTGASVHVLHLSSSDALPMLRSARRDGVRISAETCPHYLVFAAEEIRDGATEFKCCPPIREAENREQLWQGLGDGVIDFVVSD